MNLCFLPKVRMLSNHSDSSAVSEVAAVHDLRDRRMRVRDASPIYLQLVESTTQFHRMQHIQDPAPMFQNGKRRRLQGSCDNCRKKKVRCDSAEMPEKRCTNCIVAHIECTHARLKAFASPSGPNHGRKTGQEHVATILSTSTVYVPPHDPSISHQILVEVAQYARSLEEKLVSLQPQTLVPITSSPDPNSPKDESPSPATSDSATTGGTTNDLPITETLRDLTSFATNTPDRYFGQSSSVEFIKTAMKHINGNVSYVVGAQRPEFWSPQPWEKFTIEPPQQIFPENDLLKALIKIYFEQINPLLGILHFPSFHHSILDGMHFRDPQFGAIVLAVCALASRYSDDPRVFIEGTNSEHSSGWKWYRQVRPFRATFSPLPSLYQLQLICLSVMYMVGTSDSEENWILGSIGLRFAQGAGAHHRNWYRNMEPLKAELYKRVFWVLFIADTAMSSFRGRPCITQPADLDLDLPCACDEEYWSTTNPVQPIGKPSSAAFLPCFLRLMMLVGRIQGNVHPVRQPRSETIGTIVQLDSALNKWVDTIPEHLKWDPHQQNPIFLDQSATLYFTYYHAQILLHRPFISAPGKGAISNTQSHFPSLAICANAARACGHVLDVQTRRGRGLLSYQSLITALFDSAVVLLINVWAVVGGRKCRSPDDFARATADAQNCVRVLRLYERRWRLAGRKCDIISTMLAVGKQSFKRSREVEEIPTSPTIDDSLDIKGSMPGHSARRLQLPEYRSIQDTDNLFSLPIFTEELGRLPVYDSFDYEPRFQPNELHYPPRSYLDSDPDLMEPELLFGIDPALDSMFSPQQDGMTGGRDNMQLDPVSFDIPSSDNWQEWSKYLARLDVNQRSS
ncbi:fungal-specific transcription factor domain-containing protein [Mycena albidolilacea]|uniref:Fungal-specific transcription factor domain-containing protein n=1 Tax=Mycena albidolilacea TaxID=1033008 RepID=A0AAD7AJR9_9AGAR|nr:fungal-specific transcription factor domain-containing protein [Mycena albidolilacea]